ncbi:MAG: PqiC family protein, partial [Congregibacter sp.]|nr:PqiC family protein [Congregibacter sp.]
MMYRVLLACTLAYLCGCAGPSLDIQHLQLSAGNVSLPRGESPVVVINAIDLPDYLLRDDLVLRESDVTLRYDSSRRWAEPLDLGIQRVLGRRLQAALDTQRVILFPQEPSTPADWQLQVTIRRFEVIGTRVELAAEARWEHRSGGEAIIESVVFEDALPLGSSTGQDIAKTMSELLWRFSQELVAAISPRLASSQNASSESASNGVS